MQPIVAYFVSLVVFAVIDFGWLAFASNRLYRPVIGDLLAPKVAIAPGIAFYLIYWLGVTLLATAPALKAGSPGKAVWTAAVVAFTAYATYDLTNQATLKAWSIKLTLADLAWGVFATTLAALAGFFVARMFVRA